MLKAICFLYVEKYLKGHSIITYPWVIFFTEKKTKLCLSTKLIFYTILKDIFLAGT